MASLEDLIEILEESLEVLYEHGSVELTTKVEKLLEKLRRDREEV